MTSSGQISLDVRDDFVRVTGTDVPKPSRHDKNQGHEDRRQNDANDDCQTLQELEQRAIIRALQAAQGSRKVAAAQGIGLRTLYDKLKRYDID